MFLQRQYSKKRRTSFMQLFSIDIYLECTNYNMFPLTSSSTTRHIWIVALHKKDISEMQK